MWQLELICVERMNYSVPFEYIKQKVDIRLTSAIVEVFFGGNRICSHPRLYGRFNQYSTIQEHMPLTTRSMSNGMESGLSAGPGR